MGRGQKAHNKKAFFLCHNETGDEGLKQTKVAAQPGG
jgi:hypothetical protein